MRKAVLIGAGDICLDAIEYFKKSNILCVIQSNEYESIESIDIQLIHINDFLSEYKKRGRTIFGEEEFEFIVALDSIWDIHYVCNKLDAIGLSYYSVYGDVKVRWSDGESFLKRDRRKVNFERHTISFLRERQLMYMLRHTKVSDLTPAVGALRDVQLRRLDNTMSFFEKNSSLHPIAIAGTLLGAYRHGGYIPWDDDLDFLVDVDEYATLISKYDEAGHYYKKINGVWINRFGKYSAESESEFILVDEGGYVVIVAGCMSEELLEKRFCADLFPMCGWNSEISDEIFADLINEYAKQIVNTNDLNCEKIIGKMEEYMKENTVPINIAQRVSFGLEALVNLQRHKNGMGRKCESWIWDKDRIFPLGVLKFENHEVSVPFDVRYCLDKMYSGKDIMEYPDRVGVYTHYKERVFYDIY